MFIIKSQLWATAIITLIPVAMLGVIHCELHLRVLHHENAHAAAEQLANCLLHSLTHAELAQGL